MAIITLLTDFGGRDYYTSAVKAAILAVNPGISIIDISHFIEAGNIAHAGFILRSVYKDFPKGSIHLFSINDSGAKDDKFIAVKMDNMYFVGVDNGLLGLVLEGANYLVVDINIKNIRTTFAARDILAPAAAKLASGVDISNLGAPLETFKKMLNRHLRASKTQIIGNVIHIDHYGNLITNIDKGTFDHLTREKNIYISFGRENSRVIHENYYSV
ncbi:MAG: SAM-dependent chlorinase/fluorinase, partial [Cyclobacteriaceae bacterium]|nr:SAM-dependent chlorinase/fluorinase [Cyclobacteriaceae bacterium]